MKDYFNKLHPVVNFSYFVCVIGFAMFLMHPIYMGISLVAAFGYSVYLNGRNALKFNILYMLPMLLLVACINPMFNHEGATILFYLKSGNPFTLESVMYGIASSTVLITVILWFSCYNAIMSSDKIMYLFGKIIPSLSLIFAMTLRFVPLYKTRIAQIIKAQKALGQDVMEGKVWERCRKGINVLSVMTGWSLENAIETADSMKARGYGLKGRTAFSNFVFTRVDGISLAIIWGCTLMGVSAMWWDITYVQYFPIMTYSKGSISNVIGYMAYAVLCFLPLAMNIMEEIKWKYFISKI